MYIEGTLMSKSCNIALTDKLWQLNLHICLHFVCQLVSGTFYVNLLSKFDQNRPHHPQFQKNIHVQS